MQPGAQFPWHSHAGPVIVNVTSGELVYVDDELRTRLSGRNAFVDAGPATPTPPSMPPTKRRSSWPPSTKHPSKDRCSSPRRRPRTATSSHPRRRRRAVRASPGSNRSLYGREPPGLTLWVHGKACMTTHSPPRGSDRLRDRAADARCGRIASAFPQRRLAIANARGATAVSVVRSAFVFHAKRASARQLNAMPACRTYSPAPKRE